MMLREILLIILLGILLGSKVLLINIFSLWTKVVVVIILLIVLIMGLIGIHLIEGKLGRNFLRLLKNDFEMILIYI